MGAPPRPEVEYPQPRQAGWGTLPPSSTTPPFPMVDKVKTLPSVILRRRAVKSSVTTYTSVLGLVHTESLHLRMCLRSVST